MFARNHCNYASGVKKAAATTIHERAPRNYKRVPGALDELNRSSGEVPSIFSGGPCI